MDFVYQIILLPTLISFIFFQLPRGKKSFFLFLLLYLSVLSWVCYEFLYAEDINAGAILGMAIIVFVMISSFISIITRAITLYFKDFSKRRKIIITIFGLSLSLSVPFLADIYYKIKDRPLKQGHQN